MSTILVVALKVAYLALMWLFIAFIANTIRSDLFGREATAAELTGVAGVPTVNDAGTQPTWAGSLAITSGRGAGSSVPLDGVISIGRAADCTLDVDDDYASSRHARLSPYPDGSWVLEDLQSTNGTYVNGIKIAGPTSVGPGDVIRIGRSQLRLEV